MAFAGSSLCAEVDLLLVKDSRRSGFEIKCTDKPKVTHSLLAAREDLAIDELTVVYPGEGSFRSYFRSG